MPSKDTRLASLLCEGKFSPTLLRPKKLLVLAGSWGGLRIRQKKGKAGGKAPSSHPLLLFPPPGSNTKKSDWERTRSSRSFIPVCMVVLVLIFILLVALTGESHPDVPHGKDPGQAPSCFGEEGDCRILPASKDAPQAKHQDTPFFFP